MDLTDRTAMAALRGHVVAAGAGFGLVAYCLAMVGGMVRNVPWPISAGVVSWLIGMIVWVRVRGVRLGDVEFLALQTGTQMFAAAAVWLCLGAGRPADTALALLATVIVGALFLERPRHVTIQVGSAVALLAVVATGAAGSADPEAAVVEGGFAIVSAATVIRFLRDVAIDALRTARRNEVTDPLTGLANRRGLQRAGSARWGECAAARRPLALLVIDVDHFKRINDVHGHAGGDEILRRLGELLDRQLRAGDLAVRLGGEEFLMLCHVAAPGEATAIAERIRVAVEQELAPVTVSIGTHEANPSPGDPLRPLWSAIDQADHALYEAKRGGRNRVVSSSAP